MIRKLSFLMVLASLALPLSSQALEAPEDRPAKRLCREEGDAGAQYALGAQHFKGEGVLKDPKEGVRYFRLAAEQGHLKAQFNLGVAYHKGQGVEVDFKEAVKFYQLAVAQGHASAHINLGLMYEAGKGVTADPQEALRLFQLAADQGNGDAKKMIADRATKKGKKNLEAPPQKHLNINTKVIY